MTIPGRPYCLWVCSQHWGITTRRGRGPFSMRRSTASWMASSHRHAHLLAEQIPAGMPATQHADIDDHEWFVHSPFSIIQR
jgi:hypothetical protein